LSTQPTDYQREMAERLRLPFEILSDAKLAFANALALPAFKTGGMPRESSRCLSGTRCNRGHVEMDEQGRLVKLLSQIGEAGKAL
jgi:peroxiredoxin